MDTGTALDPMQENRRLRAAMDRMRSSQTIARGGIVGGAMLVAFNHKFAGTVPGFGTPTANMACGVAALVITAVASIPFLRSACPKCKKAYHRITSVLRSVDKPHPCKHCGFQINQHVSRYS
jgi:predicted RNA-binding Zn-ribbon protein involved in translation (DUF1610 family)